MPVVTRTDAADPQVPDFGDGPLMVFDGTCVFCSTGARILHRLDRAGKIRFAHAQAPLGQALYRYYGWDETDFETNILITGDRIYTNWASIAGAGRTLGGAWHVLRLAALVPDIIGDPIYDLVARNRYRLFGRTETCAVPDKSMRARMLDIDPDR